MRSIAVIFNYNYLAAINFGDGIQCLQGPQVVTIGVIGIDESLQQDDVLLIAVWILGIEQIVPGNILAADQEQYDNYDAKNESVHLL